MPGPFSKLVQRVSPVLKHRIPSVEEAFSNQIRPPQAAQTAPRQTPLPPSSRLPAPHPLRDRDATGIEGGDFGRDSRRSGGAGGAKRLGGGLLHLFHDGMKAAKRLPEKDDSMDVANLVRALQLLGSELFGLFKLK